MALLQYLLLLCWPAYMLANNGVRQIPAKFELHLTESSFGIYHDAPLGNASKGNASTPRPAPRPSGNATTHRPSGNATTRRPPGNSTVKRTRPPVVIQPTQGPKPIPGKIVPGFSCQCESTPAQDGCAARFTCNCNCPEPTPPPQEGNHTTNIVCVHKKNENRTAPYDWAYLSDLIKKTVIVKGKRLDNISCKGEVLRPFEITGDTYQFYLKQCQQHGYDLAQPTDEVKPPIDKRFKDWGVFSYSGGITAHYHPVGEYAVRQPERNFDSCEKITTPGPTTTTRPTTTIPTTTPNINVTEVPSERNCSADHNGTELVFVACVHRINKTDPAEFDWRWLTYEYEDRVQGTWKMYTCGNGIIRAFHLGCTVYSDLITRCNKRGYETAQPSRDQHFQQPYWPFQVGPQEHGAFTPFYRTDQNNEWKLTTRQVIEKCGAQDDKAPAVCVNKKGDKVTDFIYLSDFNDTRHAAEIQGKWIDYYCGGEKIRGYSTTVYAYQYVLQKCRARGYDVGQVIDPDGFFWPIQAGLSFAPHYRLKNPSKQIANSIFYPEKFVQPGCSDKQPTQPPKVQCNETNTIYVEKGPPAECERSCVNLHPDDKICGNTTKFRTGCFCEPGFVRDSHGHCADSSECPQPTTKPPPTTPQVGPVTPSKTPPLPTTTARNTTHAPPTTPTTNPAVICKDAGEVYLESGSACILTCAEPKERPCSKTPVKGCFCKLGFVRNDEGKCIDSDKCPPPPTTPKPTLPPTKTTPAPPTTTRRTCVDKSELNDTALCQKVPAGKPVSRECLSACYAKNRGHFRRAECPIGEKLCRCHYDPCRFGQMDVVFLLDTSGSLEGQGFTQEKQFIQHFVDTLTLGLNESRAGLVSFSSSARVRMYFTDPQSKDVVAKVLSRLNAIGETNIFAAFVTAAQVVKSKRPGVPQVAVLITDGVHTDSLSDGLSPAIPAKKLRDEGVFVYAVGIGREAKDGRANLIDYAGDESHVFLAEFKELEDIVNIIGAEVVAAVNSVR